MTKLKKFFAEAMDNPTIYRLIAGFGVIFTVLLVIVLCCVFPAFAVTMCLLVLLGFFAYMLGDLIAELREP